METEAAIAKHFIQVLLWGHRTQLSSLAEETVSLSLPGLLLGAPPSHSVYFYRNPIDLATLLRLKERTNVDKTLVCKSLERCPDEGQDSP